MNAIERLIASTPQGELLGGLFWRAPSAGKSRTRALQEAKSLTADATHYAQAQVGAHLRYGMYQPRASEEGLRLPKGTLAAATCFSRLVGAAAPNAALVLTVAAAGQRKEDKYFVVCLEDGVPVIDVLSNEIEARNALGGEDRPIWSDNPVAYPNCATADFAWLATGADKSARVQAIPINPWPFLTVTLALVLIVAGWLFIQRHERAEQSRRDEAAARAADPMPKYLAALAAQRPAMGVDRAAMLSAVGDMFLYRTWIPGWRLAAAECNARLQACTREWVRRGGSFDDLRSALPHDTLEMIVPQGSTVPVLDAARTTHPVRLPRVDLLALAQQPLRSLQGAMSEAGPRLQSWRTAEIFLDLKRPALWPRVPELPSSFQHPRALMAGEAEMRDVPAPFILEALRAAPDFISWEAVRVEVGEGADVKALLKFSARGVFYAAAR
jgi:hypothetical protein